MGFQNENQHLPGSPVYICSDTGTGTGTALQVRLETCSPPEAEEVCAGSTRPFPGGSAFYHVRCGSSSYVGPDVYHFQPVADVQRPYVCQNDATARPEWTLLGFFICEQLA